MKYWAIYLTKIVVEKDQLSIKRIFSRANIPFGQIASVNKNLLGIQIETSGGKVYKIILWNRRKENELFNIINIRK